MHDGDCIGRVVNRPNPLLLASQLAHRNLVDAEILLGYTHFVGGHELLEALEDAGLLKPDGKVAPRA